MYAFAGRQVVDKSLDSIHEIQRFNRIAQASMHIPSRTVLFDFDADLNQTQGLSINLL